MPPPCNKYTIQETRDGRAGGRGGRRSGRLAGSVRDASIRGGGVLGRGNEIPTGLWAGQGLGHVSLAGAAARIPAEEGARR